MKKLKSIIIKPWWRIYSRIRSKRIAQTTEQTTIHLVGFYLFSVSLSFLLAAINVWKIPIEQGFVGLITTTILVILGYDFIKDVIATELDATIKDVKEGVRNEFREKIQILESKVEKSEEGVRNELCEKIQILESELRKSNIENRQHLDRNYLSYLKQSLGYGNIKLQEVNSKLKEAYSENRLAFGEKLDEEFRNNKDLRKVRCIIHDLDRDFLQQLAVQGIIDGLNLKVEEVIERTKIGNDLQSLRVDIYAYLSAWLICSIDNDFGLLMPLEPIGMRYMNENGEPDKETYKKIIRAIINYISFEKFRGLTFYPKSDPLSSKLIKITIIDYLNRLLNLPEFDVKKD